MECEWELVGDLPDGVNELEKDWGSVVVVVLVGTVSDPVRELVPERQPLFLDEHLEGRKKIAFITYFFNFSMFARHAKETTGTRAINTITSRKTARYVRTVKATK